MRRDADAYPRTWEVPIACFVALICVAVAGLQVGRSMAYAIAGRGWVWPAPEQLLISVPPLLAGVTNAGLGAKVAPIPTGLVTLTTVGTELVCLIAFTVLGWQVALRFGPGVMSGLASAGEADRLLGRLRLARARKVVRPDLYSRASRNSAVDGTS